MADEQNSIKTKNYINALILLLIVGWVVYYIFNHFSKSSSVIMSFVGLGIVIFIHELGHFAAGKFCGIKVEAFSVGFGSIVLGVKRIENYLRFRILPTVLQKDNDPDGEGLLCIKIPMRCKAGATEYQLRIFPLGGFVKLMGQEDLGSDKPSEDPRSFVNVAIWKRIVTVSAGVTMNIILAAILFVIVFKVGIKQPPAVIGDCLPGYPAAQAGLKAGDEIIAINGRGNLDYTSVIISEALTGKDKAVDFKVKRTDGSIKDYNLVPIPLASTGLKGIGIMPATSLKIAKVQNPKELNEQYGLKSGDVLTAVNGEKVEQAWQLSNKLENYFEPTVALTFTRPGQSEPEEKKIELNYYANLKDKGHENYVLANIYGLVPRLKVIPMGFDEANEPLKSGDIILKVGDISNPTYNQLREVTVANAGKSLGIAVLRGDKIVEVNVVPKNENGRVVIGIAVGMDAESLYVAGTTDSNTYSWPANIPQGAEIVSIGGAKVNNYFDIAAKLEANKGKTIKIEYSSVLGDKKFEFAVPAAGGTNVKELTSQNLPFDMLTRLYRANGASEALKMGSRKTLEFVAQTYMTLKGLITRDISPNSLMGPVGMIAASTKIISEREFIHYLHFLGMISACLAVFNFLPLPIFDGGLVVLLIIEKIKGSPVHAKIQEGLVYIGLVLILGLFILVTYNDIVRWGIIKWILKWILNR
jgi:regulator of sigma E protease